MAIAAIAVAVADIMVMNAMILEVFSVFVVCFSL